MWKVLVGIVMTTAVITASIVLYRQRHHLFRPDVGRVGGTRLMVRHEGKALPDEVAAILARRFDPTGGLGIVVRDSGDDIEIDVPNGRDHDDHVERIKRLIGRPGRLRMGILAHQDDDGPAIAAARKWLTPANAKALEEAQDKGLLLPRLRNAAGEDRFDSKKPGEPSHRYSWVYMNPAAASVFTGTGLHVAAGHRENWPIAHEVMKAGRGGPMTFVVMREPADREGITNGHIVVMKVLEQGRGAYSTRLHLRLDAEGRTRLNDDLTRKLTGSRRLALALDDEVMLYFDASGVLVHASFDPLVDRRSDGEDRIALIRAPLPEGTTLTLREERTLPPGR